MTIDRVLHPQKSFAELSDEDVGAFLRARNFRTEQFTLEFKEDFSRTKSGNVDVLRFCAYLVGLSNADGGFMVFGVADSVNDQQVSFPSYVRGVSTPGPSLEDLSNWGFTHVRPLLDAVQARSFCVEGRNLWVLRVPRGINAPYCVVDPRTGYLGYFRKTSGTLRHLSPEEVRDLQSALILERATTIVQRSATPPISVDPRIAAHIRTVSATKLEDTTNYGHVIFVCRPRANLEIPIGDLQTFLVENRHRFSEAIRYAPRIEVSQHSVGAGYFPTAIRTDIKSTTRVTLYDDGMTVWESQIDHLYDNDKVLNPHWLAYELQRHLQLTKAILEPRGTLTVDAYLDLRNVDGFQLVWGGSKFSRRAATYPGTHTAIVRAVELAAVPSCDGVRRNFVADAVKDAMSEVARVFGLAESPAGLWDSAGYLEFVRGLEGQR